MIEMRWLTWQEEEVAWPPAELIQFGRKYGTKSVTKRKLQYRQMVDTAVYAGLDPFSDSAKNMQWSEWRDVPLVAERDPGYP